MHDLAKIAGRYICRTHNKRFNTVKTALRHVEESK